MVTADELRQVVQSLPEAEERETWGHPTLLRELLVEAWRQTVPKRLVTAYDSTHGP